MREVLRQLRARVVVYFTPLHSEEFQHRKIDPSYLTFISIVFGVFIAVWVQPLEKIFEIKFANTQFCVSKSADKNLWHDWLHAAFPVCKQSEGSNLIYVSKDSLRSLRALLNTENIAFKELEPSRSSKDFASKIEKDTGLRHIPVELTKSDKPLALDTFLKAFLNMKMFQGLVMFWIMICLWWWYAIFLGRIRPAKGLSLYAYDFVTLGAFAFAFRFWDHNLIYPTSVVIAGFMIVVRLWWTRKYYLKGEKDVDARVVLKWGIVLLSSMPLFLIFIPLIFPSVEYSIALAVMMFHAGGILVTIAAAIRLGVFGVLPIEQEGPG